ncbi:TlpA family protein disulfide reductase [Tahibacter amnicola]|uniref:TlpA family protein disulfide reductase n=1 Tax=Tahibacter amnicola TaxID=2976241 RepID=A0ABY6BBM7_9GAMM|nr:TlpA disulfide reductase family protein [Tahibacter amnicola]UXI67459.1 TlpA family protein disulfide reductase [Tahibacter amnicola]
MKRFLASLLIALAAGSASVEAAETPAKPELSIQTLDGKTFDLSAQKGKWVIVNFWATWCSPCIKELPEISRFVKEHSNVAAVGLAYEDTDKAEVLAFLKTHPVSYPVAQVDVFDPPKSFETPRGLPMTYVIAPDGTVAKKFTGPITETDLAKVIGGTKS